MINEKQTSEQLAHHAKEVRKYILQMIYSAQSGHPGGSLSATDLITTLYFNEMDIHNDNVDSKQRDRFVLSKGHASPLLYAILKEKGLLKEDITTFRQLGSTLQGHPNMNEVNGVDMSTGSLGQGISCAVGMALANQIDQSNHRIYALIGDGESEEGQVWEAAMAAAHYKLDNLCAILDYNGLQIDGDIRDVMNPEPLDQKFVAFGWHVISIDGHDYEAIMDAFSKAREYKGKPTLILAKTIKGKGISYMEHNPVWHGNAPNDELYHQALTELEGQ